MILVVIHSFMKLSLNHYFIILACLYLVFSKNSVYYSFIQSFIDFLIGVSLRVERVRRAAWVGGGGRVKAWRSSTGEGRSRMEGEEVLREGEVISPLPSSSGIHSCR